ncbi:MAG: glycosyltransferase [Bacteroidales bacterium]|nr:glycosyltransferase [Bacteroidales bacterium]
MRIVHYIPSIDKNSGGVGVYMQTLARDLGRMVDLHIITHESDDMLTIENGTLHFIPQNNNPFSNKSKADFLQLLDELKPDVFHTNCCWLPQSARTALWAKNKGYKVVYSPHGMLEPWIVSRNYWVKKLPATLLFQRRGVAIADVVLTTAESEKNNFKRLGWNPNVEVIPNGLSLDSIPLKDSWHRNRKILFLSRIHEKKGVDFLIEAVAQLREELSGYTIQIAGSGDENYERNMISLANKLGVSDMVQFMGAVYDEAKYELYRNADLFVLPTHSENFGIVVTESLASGTPVITTHGTPWKELSTENCGWWIPVGTAPLVEALREFLKKDEEDLEQMGRRGRHLVETRYSSEVIASDFVRLYERLKENKNA